VFLFIYVNYVIYVIHISFLNRPSGSAVVMATRTMGRFTLDDTKVVLFNRLISNVENSDLSTVPRVQKSEL
jgi:hypothetical protein